MSGSTARPLGLAVVGTGMVAGVHLRALGELRDLVSVRGCYARSKDKRQAFAAQHGIPAAESLEDLIADPAVEAVLVLTPPNARKAIIDAACAAGKHVLMEKPVERTLDAATALVTQCEQAGITLAMVLQHRFRAGAIRLKALIDGGTLGPICAVRVSVPWWRAQSYYDEPGRGTYARDGGGVLISQAIHTLDLMIWLAGLPTQVQAVAGTTRLHRMEAEDFVAAGLRFGNGALGSLMATTAAFPGETEELAIDFERASARLAGSQLEIHHHGGEVERFGESLGTGGGADPMAFPHDWHKALIADFATAVRNTRPPAVPGREALRAHRLIDALTRSSALGQACDLDAAHERP